MSKLISDHEIAVDTFEDAVALTEILLRNQNVVMISREEQFYVVNYEYSELSDRNDMVFISCERYDADWDERCKECQEDG